MFWSHPNPCAKSIGCAPAAPLILTLFRSRAVTFDVNPGPTAGAAGAPASAACARPVTTGECILGMTVTHDYPPAARRAQAQRSAEAARPAIGGVIDARWSRLQ